MSGVPRVTGREFAFALVICVAAVGILVAITGAEGALGVARNDDWSFIQNAFTLHDNGTIAVTGWVQMLLIGQLLLAYPVLAIFGNSIVVLQLLGAALGVVLLITTYLLARGMLPVRWALLAPLTLAIGPLFGTLAVSFMTDVPSAALQVTTVLLGVYALRQAPASRGWLVVAGAAGVLAFSVREYGIIALAVVAIMVVPNRRGYGLSWRFVILWAVALMAAGLLLVRWRAGQVTENASEFGPNLDGLRLLTALPVSLGLLVLPAVAFVNPVRLARAGWRASRVLTVISLVLVSGLALWSRFGFLGNYWSQSGAYSQSVLGDPAELLSRPIWLLITAVAVLSAEVLGLLAALALATLVARWRAGRIRSDALANPAAVAAALFVVGTIVLVATMATLLRIPVFDRYFLAIIGPAAGLVLWVAHRGGVLWQGAGRSLGWAGVAILALAGMTTVSTAAALDGAKWRLAASTAERLGVGTGNIDGGFEWFSFHTDGAPRPADYGVRWTWWTAIRDDRAVCASLLYAGTQPREDAARPDPNLVPLARETVRPLPWVSIDLIVVPGPDSCS